MSGNVSIILVLICLLFLVACRSEPSDTLYIDRPDLKGEWVVNNAFRNGTPTGTLDGAKFNFTSSLFSSNVPGFIFGEDNVGEYRVSADTIYTGILRPSFFIVNHMEENTLTLSTLIQGYKFQFDLKRIGQDE